MEKNLTDRIESEVGKDVPQRLSEATFRTLSSVEEGIGEVKKHAEHFNFSKAISEMKCVKRQFERLEERICEDYADDKVTWEESLLLVRVLSKTADRLISTLSDMILDRCENVMKRKLSAHLLLG